MKHECYSCHACFAPWTPIHGYHRHAGTAVVERARAPLRQLIQHCVGSAVIGLTSVATQ